MGHYRKEGGRPFATLTPATSSVANLFQSSVDNFQGLDFEPGLNHWENIPTSRSYSLPQ